MKRVVIVNSNRRNVSKIQKYPNEISKNFDENDENLPWFLGKWKNVSKNKIYFDFLVTIDKWHEKCV